MVFLIIVIALAGIMVIVAMKEKYEQKNEPEQGTFEYYAHRAKEYENKSIDLVLKDFYDLIKPPKKISPAIAKILTECGISLSEYEEEIILLHSFSIDYFLFNEISDGVFYKDISSRWLTNSLKLIRHLNREEATTLREGRLNDYFKALEADTQAPEGTFTTQLGSLFLDKISKAEKPRPIELMGLANAHLESIYQESTNIMMKHMPLKIKTNA